MKKTLAIILTVVLLFMSSTVLMPAYASNLTEAEVQASALKQLGLFNGVSATDFDLYRAPTRTEVLVMLIRVLGRESEALNGIWSHPFTDVASWADKYVGFAYQNGLTNGVSSTEFGTGTANSDMYLTLVLRALGYNDSAGDFVWNEPDKLAKSVGILPDSVDTANFLRADVALVSWAALNANLKGSSQTLANKLISAGTFTADNYVIAQKLASGKASTPVSVSSAKELKTALADSSVSAIVLDSIGSPIIITDQLTIPTGITVTVNRGNDFYIEGTLINNGTIKVMGANSIDAAAEFINYSVMSVQNGGKLVNNGVIELLAATLNDISDHGPVGGQLRLINGTLDNTGSVTLEAGKVNTHGGMADVADGTFNNNGTVVVNGFFLRVRKGVFVNNVGATVTNNSHIFIEEAGIFTNKGTLLGNKVNE